MCDGAANVDLWVIPPEVAVSVLPRTFARLRDSSRRALCRAHIEVVSADTLLTSDARTGPVVTHEPGPDLRFLS